MSWQWTEDALGKLEQFLTARQLTSGALQIKPIGDGHSNLTYWVSDGVNEVVVRRPPPPPMPKGAHDVLREARLIQALEGSRVAIASVLAVGQIGDVFDVPFYVMRFVPGEVITDTLPVQFSSPEHCQAMAFALVDTLVALHRVDWKAQGLENFGKPEGFNRRHFQRIATLVCDQQGNLPAAFAAIAQWLEQHVPPESGASIVHNDYRIGNVMWSAREPVELVAVLDWELATIGDPLLDLAYLLCSCPRPGEPRTPTQDMATAVLREGFPSREVLAQRYAAATGFDISQLRWYQVLVNWKLAVMYDYSRRRGEDSYYLQPGLVERFLTAAQALIDG